jgi:hypothetical protein
MELLLGTALHLNVLKQAPACTTKEIRMVAIVTSNHGKDNLQVLQLPGSKIDSIMTTMGLATMADLHLLHGRVAIVVATATAATVVLLVAVLHHGSSRHLPHHLLLVSLVMVMVRILATIKALVMEHLHQQLRRVSARSCNNMLVHLRLHPVTDHLRLRHPTMLLRRHRHLITLPHLPRLKWSYGAVAIAPQKRG